jgi:large subunit ribosomal protein L32e
MTDKLEMRNERKSKKPTFRRQDSNKYSFKNKWRKPRGLHNKRRLSKKGHQKNPSIGYGSPKEVKYLTKEGLNRVMVNNLQDLKKINKEKDIIILSSKLGMKKKLEVVEGCISQGLKIESIKDPKKYAEDKKALFEEKKKQKKKKLEKKEKTKKELVKKAKEKEEKKDEDSEDKQKEIKEDVMSGKQKEQKIKPVDTKKMDSTKAKASHMASSVPGTKQ